MFRNHSFNIGDIVKVKGSDFEMEITTLGGKKALFDNSERYNGKVTCKWYVDGMDTYSDFNIDELEFIRTNSGVNVEKKRGLFTIILCLLLSVNSMAYDFEVDGLCYNILSLEDLTVEVTSGLKYSGKIVIPDNVIYKNKTLKVVRIGEKAFYDKDGITELIIGNSVTHICQEAFVNCSITKLTIPKSVSDIYDKAFYGCPIDDLIIEDSDDVLDIRHNKHSESYSGMFSYCPLKTLYLGRTLYYNSKYGNYDTSISPFIRNKNLKSVVIGDHVKNTKENLFRYCSNLTSVTFGKSLTTINRNAFAYTGLKNVFIGNSVTTIESEAFAGCNSLTSLVIGNSIKNINYRAFKGCGLTYISIGESIKEIEREAFSECRNLAEIRSSAPVPPVVWDGNFDNNNFINTVVKVPKGSLSAYQTANVWKNFWDIQEDPALSIDDVQMDTHNTTAPIYTLQGVQVKEAKENLPAGIYIQSNKKFIVK